MDSKKIAILTAILAVALAASCIVPMDETDAATVEYNEAANALIITDVTVSAGQFVNPEITDGTNTVKLTQTYTSENAIPVVLNDKQSRPFTLVPGTEYTITVKGTTGNVICTATYTAPDQGGEVDPEPTPYTITLVNESNALVTITDAEGQAVTESTQLTGEQTLTVTATPAQGVDVESVSINGEVITTAPYTVDVTVSADNATITVVVNETQTPVDPEEDPADRPFTNQITLGDGAVIDATSSIRASSTQEVVIAGDVTVAADGFLDIYGKLTIQAGAVLTIEEGGNVIIQKDGIVDVQGDLFAEAGAVDDVSFQYGGCLMTVAGSVTLEGANSFATTATAEDIQISGTFEVGDEATAVLDETTVAEGGELLVYGVVTGTVANNGSITVDSQGLADGTKVDMTVQLKATGTVDVTNVFGTVVVSDSELTFTEKKEQVDVDNTNTVTLNNVAGVTVSENLVIEKNEDDEKNHGINTMLVAGGITVADDYNSSEGLTGSITVAGDKVEVAEAVTLGEGVKLTVNGELTVSGEATAIDGSIDGNGTITVTGKVTTADNGVAATVKFNAALYQTERVGTSPVYNVYTTLETALTDGAVDIELLGKNVIAGAATIPVGTTVEMATGSELTIDEEASLTIVSDDRKSGKLNTATGAVDKVIVDGTMDVQNFAKSGIRIDAVLSDTSKEVEDSMSFTNVYNALENAADGETVKITRGDALTLEQNVEIRSGVTLLIPSGETVNVDHGITVTVDGTLVNQGTYDIADEIEDVETTTENEYKAAGVTVVNGMFMAVDTGLYTEEIVGAYFEYTYEKKAIDAIAPLASLPAIADDIGSDIYLYGQMTLGDIDFSAYDGEGDLTTIYAVNDLTLGSLTIGNVIFDASNANAVVDGSIVLANGTVDLANVNGIIAQNTVDNDDVVTSAIRGNVTAVQDDDVEGEETATVAIGGEISSAIDTQRLVTFDVPAGATASMTDGNIADAIVAGEMVIAQNGVTFDSLAVTGTVSAEENFTATVKALYVGVTAKDLAMAGTGDVSGVVIASGNESVAYVSPNATVAEDIVKNLKTTAYYVDDALYVTAYANSTNAVKIDIDFTVENAFFDAWQYENDEGRMTDVSATDMVGSPIEEVHAKIVRDIYSVMITADAGIGTVAIDGNVLVNQGGNVFVLNGLLAAGQHTVSYTLKSGYEGTATLTVSGEGATISGMNFTLAGNPSEDATGENHDYVVEVMLSLSGTAPGDTTVVIEGDNGDDGMGLTDYLLIILVVLIIVMAIIVALRMMRS